jgi:hypothetical protein
MIKSRTMRCRECSTHGREEEFISVFGGKARRKEATGNTKT